MSQLNPKHHVMRALWALRLRGEKIECWEADRWHCFRSDGQKVDEEEWWSWRELSILLVPGAGLMDSWDWSGSHRVPPRPIFSRDGRKVEALMVEFINKKIQLLNRWEWWCVERLIRDLQKRHLHRAPWRWFRKKFKKNVNHKNVAHSKQVAHNSSIYFHGSTVAYRIVLATYNQRVGGSIPSSAYALRLRSCLFCEGRISVLKRWFKTPIQNAVNSGYCSSSSEPERRLYDVI